MIAAIEAALQHDVAGDPITGIRWTRRTTEKIATELATLDIQVCPRTVARILKDLDYRLRLNHKRVAAGSGPDRDQQFQYLAEQRMKFAQRGLPIVSIDTKKHELVGNFKNPGTVWGQTPQAVNDHDFRSQADGIAIPYGVYDLCANRGFVVLGTSHDTPDFAADNLVRWWHSDGLECYRYASELLVLADSGDSNAPRVRCSSMPSRPVSLILPAHRYRLSLPQRRLQVEPHRPSPVQRDQQELGRPPATLLTDDPQPHPHHHYGHRVVRDRTTGRPGIPERRQNSRRSVRFTRI